MHTCATRHVRRSHLPAPDMLTDTRITFDFEKEFNASIYIRVTYWVEYKSEKAVFDILIPFLMASVDKPTET